MNQQVLAAVFASVISTYFGALILMYVLRTFLACVSSENFSDRGFIPALSSEAEADILTSTAIRAELLAD